MSENSGGPTPTPAKEGDGHGQKKRRGQGNRGPTTTKFEGAVPLLKDYVYDVTSARNGKDSFQRTTEAIGEHIARTYKQGGDFVQAFNPTNLGFAPITDPTRPADPTDVFDIQGKTVHRPSEHIPSGIDPVPRSIMDRHRDVTIAIDIMFVNLIPFLVTVSRGIKFVTVTKLDNRQEATVRNKLKAVVRLYHHRGFRVTTILSDQEFEPLRADFPFLNTCGAGELEIRYFFVTDNVNRGKLDIEYCPTGDMWGDFFTKPLQGAAFTKMLKRVLNLTDSDLEAPSQECVGTSVSTTGETCPSDYAGVTTTAHHDVVMMKPLTYAQAVMAN